MGEYLKIDDAETLRLAKELADATGKPVADAIRQAIENALQQREAEIQAKITRVREISREFRAKMPEAWRGKTSKEIMDEIYDEDGQPR